MAAPYPSRGAAQVGNELRAEAAGLSQMFIDPPAGAGGLARLTAILPGGTAGYGRAEVINQTWGSPPDNSNLLPGQQITAGRIADVWQPTAPGVYPPFPQSTINIYLQMICHYVNKRQNHVRYARRRWRGQPPDIPVVIHLPINFYTCMGAAAGLGAYPVGHPWYLAASALLTGWNYTPDRILKMKHIFLPVRIPAGGALAVHHDILIVISPLAKSIQYLSSLPFGTLPIANQTYIVNHISHLLAVHMDRDYCSKKWQVSWVGSSIQDHQNHSGLWVTTNAMRVAFGYTLSDVGVATNYVARRRKMAMELTSGDLDLKGPFDKRPFHFARKARRPYYYPMINRDPRFTRPAQPPKVWDPMDRAWIRNFLPAAHRHPNRSWRAQNMTRAELRAKCAREKVLTLAGAAGTRSRFYGSQAHSGGPLNGFKDFVEQRVIADQRPWNV